MPHNCSKCGATCAGIPLVRPAPDPEIEALLRTNLPPSEAQEVFFRETRRAGKLHLVELETRIADVQAKLDGLLQERDSLVWNMRRCTDVLNPIRRLPSDVLCEIFAHNMTNPRNSYSVHLGMNPKLWQISTPCQWRLGMVSLNWRHTVLNYPRMWSMIDLSFWPPLSRGKTRVDDQLPFGVARLLAMHIYRSANHPLRVRLRGRIPQSLLLILISASYRWEHLWLDENNLKTVDSPLDALVSFRYNLNEYTTDFDTIREQVPLLRNVASLRRLIVDKVYPVLHPDRVIIPWSQIHSVVVNGPSLTNENVITFFKLAPKLDTVAFRYVNHPVDPSHPIPDSVHSISLKSFSLDVNLPSTCSASTKYPSTLTVLFDSLTLPALEHFRINFGGNCGLSESITRLLRRSQCALKRLALIGASTGDLEELLEADEFGNLEELFIGGLGDVAHFQSLLEILTESAALLRLQTVEINASAIVDIVTCQDAVIQFLESRQVENGDFESFESLTLHAPASFGFSETNIRGLKALRRLGTRFYIYRH
ncbi:hypothetical protein DFS33DRAFT_1367147 [Desarmillaria ectypa]|nr:hypothetical protein DFS33DRAFT_1367147 [Desarmillaria ectypa]